MRSTEGILTDADIQAGMELRGGPLQYAERRRQVAAAVTQLDIVYQAVREKEARVRAATAVFTPAELVIALTKSYMLTVPTKLYNPDIRDSEVVTMSIHNKFGSTMQEHVIFGPGFSYATASEDGRVDGELWHATPRDMATGVRNNIDFQEYTQQAALAYRFAASKLLRS